MQPTKPQSWIRPWIPVLILGLGCAGLLGATRQVDMPLRRPLPEALPDTLFGLNAADRTISPEERKISGVSEYVFRVFGGDTAAVRLSIYIGYYEAQTRGKTIHSPKNCLPGAGWEPISSEDLVLESEGYRFPVNRYLLENKGRQAVVYYWYQGRGRVTANEYLVKWEQIRDRALAGRSDEALVRIVVPVTPGLTLAGADSMAVRVSSAIVRPIYASLPSFASRDLPAAGSGS
jgi:EpsI family protein